MVARWVIGNCFPAEPTKYWIQWFPIGKPMVSYEWSTFSAYINFNISSYKITGLSSNIKYFIWFGFVAQGMCSGTGPLQSVLSETMSSEFHLFKNSTHAMRHTCTCSTCRQTFTRHA